MVEKPTIIVPAADAALAVAYSPAPKFIVLIKYKSRLFFQIKYISPNKKTTTKEYPINLDTSLTREGNFV